MEGGKGDDEKRDGNRCSAFAARGRQACSSSPATSDMSMEASDKPEIAIGVSGDLKNGGISRETQDICRESEGREHTLFSRGEPA